MSQRPLICRARPFGQKVLDPPEHPDYMEKTDDQESITQQMAHESMYSKKAGARKPPTESKSEKPKGNQKPEGTAQPGDAETIQVMK